MTNVTTVNVPGGTHGHAGTGEYSTDGTYTDADMYQPSGFGYVTNFFNLVSDFFSYVATQLTSIASSVSAAAASATSAATQATNSANSANDSANSATQAANYAAALSGTATVSNPAIGSGSKTLNASTDKQWFPGLVLVVADHAAPTTNYMIGSVTAYNSTTGVLTVSVPTAGVFGSGTPTQYDIGISGGIGAQGPQGPAGGGVTEDYSFDTGTTNADPGTGKLRFNNATQNLATAIYIDNSDINSVNMSAVFDSLNASNSIVKGQLRVVNKLDPTKWVTLNLTGVISHTGYHELTIIVTASSAASPFSASDEILMMFSRTGDSGTASDNIITADGTTALTNSIYDIDSSAGTLTAITLPASPAVGSFVKFRDIGGALFACPVTLLHNGNNITGQADDLALTISQSDTTLIWRGSTTGWQVEIC